MNTYRVTIGHRRKHTLSLQNIIGTLLFHVVLIYQQKAYFFELVELLYGITYTTYFSSVFLFSIHTMLKFL